MSNRYVLLQADGLAANVVEWDGLAPWAAPEGLEAVEAPPTIGKGWRLSAGEWLAPQEEEPQWT